MTIEELQSQINLATVDSASPTLMATAQWIKDHVVEIAWKTVDQVARESLVSPASVIRSCRSMGFDGFSALQRLVRDALPTTENLVERLGDSDALTPTRKVIEQERANLDRFDASLTKQVTALASILLGARRIGVMAGLTSTALGAYVASHLNFLLGNVSFYETESSGSWIFLRDAQASDVALVLTFPRYATAARTMIQQCKSHGLHTVVLTDQLGKSLSTGELTVTLPVSGDLFSAGPPTTVLVQMLAHELRNQDPTRILTRLQDMDSVLSKAGVFLKDSRYRIREE